MGTRAANRTRTDEIILAAMEAHEAGHKYVRLEDVETDASMTTLVAAARYLEVEYDAVEYLPGCRAVRITDLTKYDAVDRNFAWDHLWPSDVARVEAGLVEVRA